MIDEDLQRSIEDAIHNTLVNMDFDPSRRGGFTTSLTRAVLDVLDEQRMSPDDIVRYIRKDGGFIRVGSASAKIRGQYISPERLVSALALDNRRLAEENKELKNT